MVLSEISEFGASQLSFERQLMRQVFRMKALTGRTTIVDLIVLKKRMFVPVFMIGDYGIGRLTIY